MQVKRVNVCASAGRRVICNRVYMVIYVVFGACGMGRLRTSRSTSNAFDRFFAGKCTNPLKSNGISRLLSRGQRRRGGKIQLGTIEECRN